MLPLGEAILIHVALAFLFGLCAGFTLDAVMRRVLDYMARRSRHTDETG